jgi:hypothetical protein
VLATGYRLCTGHPEDQGGIGNVGWALDVDVGDSKDGRKGDHERTEEAEDGEVVEEGPTYCTRDQVSGHEFSNGPTPATTITQPPHSISPAIPRILRLVLIKSEILPTDPSAPKIAILDSRGSGYYLARDRSAGKPVVRLKEMVVSKVHALVWFGRRDEGIGEDGDNRGESEKGFWLVDCGAFLWVLLGRELMDRRLDARNIHPSPIIAGFCKAAAPLGTTPIISPTQARASHAYNDRHEHI